ncbi:MAG: metalloregulator ArsR/SmtB family transcription factor [Bacteroidetes bacterium]|jgi:DNA-binding transcriptional ArsR family regulator|nr:metalloregulator ArsR/SmtB family transcription factor [Bacteroidota bacterium]
MLSASNTIKLSNSDKGEIKLDYNILRKAVLVLRSVNHKLRQSMIKLLEENEEMTVTELYVKLRLEQSVASQHLAILRRAGVVATRREGKFIYYSLNKDRISEIAGMIDELVD